MPQIAKPGDDDVLPDMAQGDAMKLIKLDPTQHFTKPPARYSEASLVKEMEKRGIGRPSTYAAIISTIQDRGYVALHNRRFYSEKMGDIVTERLAESFSNLMDYGFTAGMEEHLDDVAQGERDWKNVLDEFYGDFKKKLEVAESPESGMRANQPVMTDIPCTTCGRPMQIRTASTGVFLGCSGYSLPPKERCKATVNLVPGDEIAADDEGEVRNRWCCAASIAARSAARRWTPTCWTRSASCTSAVTTRIADGYEDRRGHLSHQGLRRSEPGMRQVRQRDAAQDRPFRQVLRLHQPDLQEHPQTAEER